jgi:protein-disulfide isomerase
MDDAAKAQGIGRAALVEKEITSKVTAVSESDIEAWYRANQGRVQGAPLEQVRQPIRAYLTQERMEAVRQQFINTLKTRTPVKVMLEPPRQNAAMAATSPVRGPANAPIEIVEWSDFQ